MQVTGIVEVLLRDTIDTQLKTWNQSNAGTSEWIVHPAAPLQFIVKKNSPEKWWQSRSNHREDNPTHDDLVAGLTFGT